MGNPDGMYLPQGRSKPVPKPQQQHQQWSPLIVGALNQLNEKQQYQYAVMLIDRHGVVTLETSSAFKGKAPEWFPPGMIEEARNITMDEASYTRKDRKKMQGFDIGNTGSTGTSGGLAGVQQQSFDDDNDRSYGILKQEPQSEYLSPPLASYGAPRSPDKRPYPIDTQLSTKRRRSMSNRPGQGNGSGSNSPESSGPMATMQQRTPMLISDESAVTAFFETRFRQMQQLTCKVISKAWTKVIEPKKQSNFPYNRGEESKPSWWPEGVRHREPDHLMKPERLKLLMTMLRCRRVKIAKLEMATDEVRGHIEACRLGLLDEVYKIAKLEERYADGLLPVDTTVYVASSADKITSKVQTPRQKQEDTNEGSELSPAHSPSSAGSLGTPEAVGPPTSSMRAEDSQPRDPRRDMIDLHSAPLRSIVPTYGSRHPESPMYNPSTPTDYMGENQPMNGYPFGRSASFNNNALPLPRRTQSIPQSPYGGGGGGGGGGGWPVHVQPGVYPQYTHNNPQQSSEAPSASHPLGGYQGNPSHYNPLNPLRPPLHSMPQHHQNHDPHTNRHGMSSTMGDNRAQYDGVRINPIGSYQDFLAAPMSDANSVPSDVQGNPPGHGGGMPH